MKRFLCLLLAFLLVVGVAYAEIPNISSLTDDELNQLKEQIKAQEIERGLIKSVKVPRGRYIVGEEIPAGSYTVEMAKSDVSDVNSISVTVWGKEYVEYDYSVGTIYSLYRDDPQFGKCNINLSDGNVVDVSADTIFTKYTGLGF